MVIYTFWKNIYKRNILIISKMKRKVVLHGPSTLTISLPANWVKKFNIKKGEELDVVEHGKELRINTNSITFEKKQIDLENLERLGRSYVTSSYRQGYDEIDFTYGDSNYIKTIQNIITRETTGFEIIRQYGNSCTIKDLTGHSRDEFNTALRRIWLLLLDLSNESLVAIKKNNPKELKNIKLMDYSINKFSNYCLRILIKKSHYDFKKTPLYYYFVKSLEEIADQYKDLCNFHSENLKKIDKDLLELFDKTNSHLNSLYELFYKYDKQKIEELFRETKLTNNEISDSDNKLAFYLSSICRDIRNLLPLIVEINL